MRLHLSEAQTLISHLPHWELAPERGGALKRQYLFQDFAQAFAFMAQVALVAEKRDHHPEWFNVYNRVDVTLTTHDVEGVSMKDIGMARAMDSVAAGLAMQTPERKSRDA